MDAAYDSMVFDVQDECHLDVNSMVNQCDSFQEINL